MDLKTRMTDMEGLLNREPDTLSVQQKHEAAIGAMLGIAQHLAAIESLTSYMAECMGMKQEDYDLIDEAMDLGVSDKTV